ncbi:transcriptional repressor [Oceanotoga sp. DSM 15011]|jgi:Fur family ferric uptake transcriptional regulator|uniref:Fur family transcriptional regulator n=1 Tax=Oceanotoga TaxID=1255275 RepID=UPI0021F4A821|nr:MULTISPECIES: transcriptional repressor [Oceanotoga]MDN5343840.1 Fur family transcriptional regulator, ferric uptake regulator [Oceanotoga sp.]MDO7977581.1 transcriptional repressor [Oceanotoga teriensis]UYO99674.1 transcriptional repressor [Oceanotoga sp. DSM 15011]
MTQQDLLKSTLKNRKQRMTAQRELILRIFMESNGRLMSIDDVFMEIRKKRNQRTSKMTVKRAIDLLVELKLIKEIRFDEENIKYEYIRKDTEEENVVLICENCAKAERVNVSKAELLTLLKDKINGFEPKEFTIKIKGYCKECSSSIDE